MRMIRSRQGYTFLELVLAIAVLGLAIPALMSLFSEITLMGAQTHNLPTVAALATELAEEIKSRKFDELDEKDGSGNWSTSLGPNTGESAKNNFDDVDDFNGWAQNFGVGFTGYNASVTVSYVASNDLNTPLIIPSPVPSDWTPSYKRIVVSVTHVDLPAPVQLVTVVTEAQSL